MIKFTRKSLTAVAFASFVLLFALQSQATQTLDADGQWWKGLSDESKLAVVVVLSDVLPVAS